MIPAANTPASSGLLAVLTLLCTSIFASGSTNPRWHTRVWQTGDGLPDNNVEAVSQGPDGYLWVATRAGLARFDGVRFSQFSVEKLTSSNDEEVRMILPGRGGVLWMASDDGRIVGLTSDFSTVSVPNGELPPHYPQAMAQDKAGALWLGYFGSPWTGYSSAVFEIKDGQTREFGTRQGLPGGNFHSVVSDREGTIWMAKGKEILIFQNGHFHRIAGAYVTQCLAASRTNSVWLVENGHLLSCDRSGIKEDCGTCPGLSGADTLAVLEDDSGGVWIGTDGNGLFRYSDGTFEKIETSHPTILCVAEDREGNIWAGTGGGGLDRISRSGIGLEGMANDQIESICQDGSGTVWGATQNGALLCRVHDAWKPAFTNASFAGTARCVTDTADGTVWVGLRDGQLVHVAGTNYAMPHIISHVRSSIFALLPAPDGDLWVLRRDMLQRLHNGQYQDFMPPKEVHRISAITEDADGNLWIGARGIVMRFDGKNFTDESSRLPISGRPINCLYSTGEGSIWISCSGTGLLRLKKGSVGKVGPAQGLYDNDISQIVADDRGWIWFGSGHGIFKIRQEELEMAMNGQEPHLRPVVYGKNEGLNSIEALSSTVAPFVLPRAMMGSDGQVWMLAHTGAIVADPNTLRTYSTAPSVLLTGVAMDGQAIASYGDGDIPGAAVLNAHLLRPIALELPPAHRHLEFDFTAFHFSAPENIHFRYKLEGFDTNWIAAGPERDATYSRLVSGNYQFYVEACIGDGPWSDSPATLAFAVTPFLWDRWSFRAGLLLLFTSAVIAIVRYISFRRLQAQMRLIEQRAALDKERTRIARDLHDDLGGSLNSVALTLDMAQRLAATEAVNGKLRHCSTMVRQVAKSVDEIVWAINPRNDTLRYMVDYISQFAVEYLHTANIPCRVDLPDTIPNRMVSPEARHNLLLIVKEALSNVARHAVASEVLVSVETSERHVAITIRDNGRGFDRAPDNGSSDGLRNMRQRAEEIGGQFQLESRSGKGTRVSVTFPGLHEQNPNMP
ncbi:MAG TPA: two-component regulator propeller domain-containing protein [Verrucomicrobiae bacterium]|nr:two-component regulator propeller domain-containing protein [Verrucomicrobiae bacterium]